MLCTRIDEVLFISFIVKKLTYKDCRFFFIFFICCVEVSIQILVKTKFYFKDFLHVKTKF
jgi:hypothetical protein